MEESRSASPNAWVVVTIEDVSTLAEEVRASSAYYTVMLRGEPITRRRFSVEAVDRFVDAVVQVESTECVKWPGALSNKNPAYGRYGRVRGELAHRRIYLLRHGLETWPADKPQARHLCGVRDCVNWAHIVPGTQSENELDKREHGTSAHGERHGQCRYSSELVAKIRSRRSVGKTHEQIGRELGVSRRYVGRVLDGSRRPLG